MCCRFTLTTEAAVVAEHFEAEADAALLRAAEMRLRYNIAPTQSIAVVRPKPASQPRELSLLQWGLIPAWSKDIKQGTRLFNARAESVALKPAFREAFRERRCLIPADGFYEWKKDGKTKRPFHFGMKDHSLFAFAGIWDRWKSPEGKVIESCSILTTTPNEQLTDVHDRMPVILHRDHYEAWLAAPPAEARNLAELLVPFEASKMVRYEVSPLVNSPKNDSAECVQSLDS